MTYPQIIDYNEVIQDPSSAFLDNELRKGKVAETPLGLPLALSGGFALTYTVDCRPRKFAVRCFHREVPGAQARYAAISTKLRSIASPHFVNFDFQPLGIRIRGRPYPIVKMDWVEGQTLGVCLESNARSAASLAALRQGFVRLAHFLEGNGVAHGDIQNENVIVSNGVLRLIDYDGMFVQGMNEGRGTEVGHKHFQHPQRQGKHFGPRMDRFSFIVIDVSLEALLTDPSLHRRFCEGGQAIIFKANDFADPSSSEVFRLLNGMPALRESAKKFSAVCDASISDVPSLSDFIAGHNIPIVVPRPVRPPTQSPIIQTYIGAYAVLDGTDFHAVMRHVGDKIELVGQIVSVKRGTGKRGRGRGKPYVFINFGQWNKESVKITIWSEGLANLRAQPDASWEGKWISVTGLVEPPYEGQHYGRPYRNVGIAVDSGSQIIHVAEREAKFRLGQRSPAETRQGSPSKRSNEDILRDVQGGRASGRAGTATPRHSRQPHSRQAPSAFTKNQAILQTVQPTTGRHGRTQHPQRTFSQPSRGSRIPAWVWIAGAILLLWLLTRRR